MISDIKKSAKPSGVDIHNWGVALGSTLSSVVVTNNTGEAPVAAQVDVEIQQANNPGKPITDPAGNPVQWTTSKAQTFDPGVPVSFDAPGLPQLAPDDYTLDCGIFPPDWGRGQNPPYWKWQHAVISFTVT